MRKFQLYKNVGATMQLACMIIVAGLALCTLCSHAYIVASDSMEPTIHPGDFVMLWGLTQPEKLKEGDVAGYMSPNGLTVVHRTVAPYLDNDTDRVAWIMKGDANEGEDVQLLTSENMVGKLYLHIDSTHVTLFKWGLRAIYLVPILLVFVGGVLRTYGDMKLTDKPARVTEKSK